MVHASASTFKRFLQDHRAAEPRAVQKAHALIAGHAVRSAIPSGRKISRFSCYENGPGGKSGA
jgi:hypothetical protein